MMTDTDHIPVKDTNIGGLEQRAAQQRRMVGKWSRDELEDKYLRLSEENIILKKHARKQEEKIKRMATKLLRLVNDKKKTGDIDVHIGPGGKKIRDIETEEKMEELHDKIRDLEKLNSQYKEKLQLAKQQLVATSKRPTHYSHMQARINTGIPKAPPDPRLTRNIRVTGPPPDHRTRVGPHSPKMPRYGQSMVEDTRGEMQRQENVISQQQEQINMYELEIRQLKEQLHLRETEYEEDLVKIKHQITAEQKVSVQENIDLIKLQREVKEKSTQLLMLQEKYSLLEENLHTVKRSHDTLLIEMENTNLQLKEEQNRSLALQNELKLGSTNQQRLVEMQEQVTDLQRETEILKDANEKLVKSAFDLEREREWRQKENALKVQIAQLEATLKADLGEKGGILDKLAIEKDQYDKMAQEFREMQLNHYQLREKYDDLVEKMKFFTKESAVDFTEIEEALVLVKQKKQKLAAHPDFLQQVDEELEKDSQKRLLELQAEYADTIHELEKTRNMLVVQHKINKDYQQEVVLTTNKTEEMKKEYEMKLDEYARLLDLRQARIKKLESQLRDVAYGTRQYKIQPSTEETDEDTIQFDETIHLERGQNLFEIHITKVTLSADALRQIGDEDPSLFCTWEFFEYEIQSTPVLRGSRPEFDFTSQYIVKVDDFFLHYLQKDSCTVELHQSFGQDFSTVAACQVTFKEIFDKTHGRIHGTASLTGVQGSGTGLGFGTLEYWVRLRVPMDQALRLYKERTKALGYVTTNIRATDQALEALDEAAAKRPPDNVNDLHIKLIRCTSLKPRRENVQPSPYCVYQFYDFNDHDTVIIHSSNNPEFNDHKTFPVPMTSDLDNYLKTMPLKIFVFDDTDPEQTSYLGIADIPLIPLAHDKGVAGVFELKGADGRVNGCVEVELRWQFTYMSPEITKTVRTQQQLEAAPDEPPQKLVPDRQPEVTEQPQARQRMAAKFPSGHGPSATSTPMARPRDREEMRATEPPRRQLISPTEEVEEETVEPVSLERDSMVHDAVSRVVSNILPAGSDTMTTLNDTTPGRVEEELARTPPPSSSREDSREAAGVPLGDTARSTLKSDTMFGDTPRVSETESVTEEITEEVVSPEPSQLSTMKEEPVQETEDEESESPLIESDSEGLVMARKPSKRKQKAMSKPGDTVTIAISHVSLEEGSSAMSNENIKQLFVEYKFLTIDAQETETPFSLPKPKPYHQIQFNFSKTFHVDLKEHYERRQYLASMLLPSDPDDGRIRFTLVSEPPEDDQEGECEDVGFALVSIRDILRNRKDVIDSEIDIVDVKDETTVIGSMNLTVQCLEALEAVEKEMQVEGTY